MLSRRHCLREVKQTKSNLHFKTNDLVRGRSKVNIYLLTEFISVEVGRHLEVAGSQVLGTRGLVTTFPLLPVHHAKLCSLCNAVIYPTIFIFMLSCIKVRRNENWARMNDFHAKSVVIICVSMSIVKSFAKSNWPPRRWSHHLRCRRHSISSKFDKHNKLPQKPNRQ